MKVNLSGVPETLLITLRIRAIETMRADAAFKDPYAVEILKQIEFDKSSKDKVSTASQVGTSIRTIILDNIIKDFSLRNPQGVIINLGCGLDARCKRLPLKGNQWFDVDVEESMAIRRLFFEETSSYKMINKSMLDYTWMDAIPKEQPLLCISEGVMMYFDEKEIKALFNEIAGRFSFAEIAFDTINELSAKNHKRHPDVKKYNAPFKWGINNSKALEYWNPDFHILKEYYYINYLRRRWPLSIKLVFAILPSFKKSFRIIHMKLNK